MDEIFLIIVIVTVIAFMVFVGIGMTGYENSQTEVERYTVGCEITNFGFADRASTSSAYHTETILMGVRCDDFATSITISQEDFGRYNEGEIVEIEVVVYEYRDGGRRTTYNLIGPQE